MSFTLASNLSIGNVIKIKDKLCEILSKEHVKPGKGPAYIQLSCKDYLTGKKNALRPNSGERFERVNIYVEEMQPLYLENDIIIALDKECNEYRIPLEMLEDKQELFSLNQKLNVYLYEEKIIKCTLPDEIVVKILETPPYQKGSRSKLGNKQAKISENIFISIPSNLDEGYIIINTTTLTFIKKYTQDV